MRKKARYLICFTILLSVSSCYRVRMSNGGGQTQTIAERKLQPSDILLMPGYEIKVVTSGLTFPTGVTFDDAGRLYVIEAGYAYGEVWEEPHLIRINEDGSKTILARGSDNGPWTGVVYHDGNFYVSEGGNAHGGKSCEYHRAEKSM